jgi:hypothetical protein
MIIAMKTKTLISLSATALLILAGSLGAQVSPVVSYQGRVKVQSADFTGTGQFKFALVSSGTNVSRQATATATVTSGFITGITVTDGGGGYTSAPVVTIADATGSGAIAVAQVSGGVVTNISIQNAGSGYSSSPTVTIASPPLTIVHGTFWSNDGTSSAGSEPSSSVSVTVQQGLFTVFLGDTNLPNMQPVPAAVFTQSGVHLRLWFSDGTNGFTQLSPDQRVGSVGYAMMAAQVSEGGVSGAALTPGSVSSAKIENGTLLVEDLSASLLNGAFWNLSGNSGTTPGTHFLGTTDNQALELKVNGARALRIEPNTNGAPNLIAGAALNFVTPGVVGATISGGGAGNYLGSAGTNSVTADFGTIGGGYANTIAADAIWSTIAGGGQNDIMGYRCAIGGGSDNNIAASSDGSTIAGGIRNNIRSNTAHCVIGGGLDNIIAAFSDLSTIAGGYLNDISGTYCSIGGGQNNDIVGGASFSGIAGGRNNDIGTNCFSSAIGGGEGNSIGSLSSHSTIAGGRGNNIGINSDESAIGGGGFNTVGANSLYATIPGGNNNFATNRAFAAGTRAKANHSGAFVWGDSTLADLASTNANSVTMRASGGVRIFSNGGATLGVHLAPSGGSWTSLSDRNAKENFQPVNTRAVLDKVAALPMSTWNYKSQTNGVRHIGPMAQDFKAAFGVGETDSGITTVDADGVALAAIQGLNQKVEEKSAEIQALKAELATIKQALQKITQQKE